MRLRYSHLLLLLVGFGLSSRHAGAADDPRASADPIPGYHNYDALTQSLRSLASSRSDIARMVSIGKSLEGRDIWVLEIGKNTGTPVAERPALLIVANLDGNQLVGSELTLSIATYLVEQYDNDEAVKERVDNAAFYLIPRANPDGAERMFASLQTGYPTNTRPMDDDNDGRVDEDGPEDLNGDGYVTMMRVADPMGEYMIDPADERLLKKADASKGETGAYKVYWEGTDEDGDGFYNEDAAGGVNLNRNFQHEYPYYTVGAGPHMVSELESRAIMDFVISKRNIASMLTFGPHDNLVTAPNNKGELAPAKDLMLRMFANASNEEARKTGMFQAPQRGFFRRGGGGQQGPTGRPSSGRRPETTVNTSDQEYFKKVSESYKELVGVTALPATEKPAGAFFEYGYYQFGVPSFVTPGWSPAAAADSSDAETDSSSDAAAGEGGARARGAAGGRGGGAGGASSTGGAGESSIDVKLAKWMDDIGVDGMIPWSAYTHPTLGAVEIGGFKPYEFANPPADVIAELGDKHGAFAVAIASLFANVQIAKTEVTDHGGGVFRIKAEVENAGFLPTSTAHGVTSRSVKPTMVQLGIEPSALLSGDAKTSFFPAMDGSGKRADFEWIISGQRGDTVELRVVSQKGGADVARIELR